MADGFQSNVFLSHNAKDKPQGRLRGIYFSTEPLKVSELKTSIGPIAI